MVKLSATAFADEETETEATAMEKAFRCITIPMPEECQTRIVLKFGIATPETQPEWVAGFRITRSYDCEPFDSFYEEKPDPDATEEDSFLALGDAVVSAAERASWWLVTNTGDSEQDPIGCQADAALDDWKRELDPETITESCFDDATDEEVSQAADEPAAAQGEEAQAPATIPQPTEPFSPMIVTDEAQREFDQRKSRLEEIIGRLAIEVVHLKASVKANRDSTKDYTEELEKHINRGPERLPLFELQERERIKAKKKEEAATGTKAKEEKEETTADPSGEPWRTMNLKDLAGLTPKIVEILDLEGIRTLGDWVNFPAKRGIEYTQIKNAAGGITEARMEKIAAALMAATTGN